MYIYIYPVIHTYIYPFFLRFFSHTGYQVEFSVLYNRSLLVISFIYNSVYRLISGS